MDLAARNLTAIGAFVVAAVIGVGSSVWPEYIRPHPYVVVLFGVIGLRFLLVPTAYKVAAHVLHGNVAAPTLNVLVAPVQDMQIELITHGEFSSELLLECVNRGGPCTLTADMRVTGASPGLVYKRIGYQGRWVKPVAFAHLQRGVEYTFTPKAYVATGGSAKLRVATIDAPEKPEGNAYMRLYGADDWATWDLEQSSQEELPHFIVDIEIRAAGKNGILKRTYKVGPVSRNESLRMTEV